jgi:polyphenol oxidase
VSAAAARVREVAEEPLSGDVPLWVHPEWRDAFPWLVQGTTGRGVGAEPFDLGLSGAQPVGTVLGRWRALLAASGLATAAHSRQVHGAELWVHGDPGPGLLVMDGFDGHLATLPGLLLSVSVADCVPVSLIDPTGRAVALLHSGWRGTAAGITERGVRRLVEQCSADVATLRLHCGPAICGRCYEVGPEVHRAIHPERDPPPGPAPIDVRAAIVERALALGLRDEHVTVSAHCTRCGPPDFFSHRAGSAGRQMGILGIRA